MSGKKSSVLLSLLFKILIAVLVVILIFATEYPKRQWELQARNTADIRSKMEDIAKMSFQHYYFHRYYTEDLQEMIDNLRNDSLEASPLAITWERKQVDLGEPGTRDSLLIDLEDHFRGEALIIHDQDAEQGFAFITVRPRPLYQDLGSDTLKLWSREAIVLRHRVGGLKETAYWASTPLVFDSIRIVPGPKVKLPVDHYVLAHTLDEVTQTPVFHEKFILYNVLSIKYKGSANFFFSDSAAQNSMIADERFRLLFLNQFKENLKEVYLDVLTKRREEMFADVDSTSGKTDLPRDTTLKIIHDEMFKALLKLEKPRARKSFQLELVTDHSRICRADSLDYYSRDENIQDIVFPLQLGPDITKMFNRLLENPRLKPILEDIAFNKKIEIANVDTVGQAVYVEIPREQFEHRSLVDLLFGVDPPDNPGFIYNNQSSWER